MPRLNRAFLSIQVYCSVKPNLSAFASCTAISFLSPFLVCDNKFLKTLPASHFLLKILKAYWPIYLQLRHLVNIFQVWYFWIFVRQKIRCLGR